ncbi:MAG: hypothetical protein GWO11_05225 [Desulfuromonadales bacterium]|nr:hypothetical protein [Desulfuromonadales bacterium]
MKRLRDVAREVWDLSSDGCTMAPDLDLYPCCKKHDFHYRNHHLTGIPRRTADAEFRQCVTRRRGAALGWVYWLGARLLGWPAYYDLTPRAARQSVEEGFGWYA